jgi:hypothetical protein
MAMAASEATTKPANGASIVHALGTAFASPSGGPVPPEKILEMLAANMEQLNKLVMEGKLNAQQVKQVRSAGRPRMMVMDDLQIFR